MTGRPPTKRWLIGVSDQDLLTGAGESVHDSLLGAPQLQSTERISAGVLKLPAARRKCRETRRSIAGWVGGERSLATRRFRRTNANDEGRGRDAGLRQPGTA